MGAQEPTGFPAVGASDEEWFSYFASWTSEADFEAFFAVGRGRDEFMRYVQSRGGNVRFPEPDSAKRMVSITVRVPADLLALVDDEATTVKGGRSEIVRAALNDRYVARLEARLAIQDVAA